MKITNKRLVQSFTLSIHCKTVSSESSGLLVFRRCPLSGILKNTIQHNFTLSGSVSFLSWGVGDTYWRANLNRFLTELNTVGVSHPSTEDGNKSTFRNVMLYCVFRITDNDKVQKLSISECYTPLSGQNPLKSILSEYYA
jgi:hypothetical protein